MEAPAASAGEYDRKLALLEEILAAKNDNDPRLDRDFRVLAPELRERLRERYRAFPMEARAERGLLVFLLGRNLENERDYAFLSEVLTEVPCLSLANCSALPERSSDPDEEHHHGSENDTTLAYPQLVALESLKRERERAALASPEAERARKDAWNAARRSPSPRVRQAARGAEASPL